jgi:hypothetical protein
MKEMELYSDELIDRPIKKYYKNVRTKLANYFGKIMERLPYLGNLKVRIAKLPTYFAFVRGKLAPIGKIFGLYSPENNTILIDPAVVPEIDDPERSLLKKYIDIPDCEAVLGHEMVHCDQANTGTMERIYKKYGSLARQYIEGGAAYISDLIFGQSGCYKKLKKWFSGIVERTGIRRAYQV